MKNFYFLNRRAISAPVFLKKAILLCIGLFILNTLFANETQDTIAPDIMLTDVLGNEISVIDTLVLPEGDCFHLLSFMLVAIDDCDGIITDNDAVWGEVEMMPLGISPETQMSVNNNGLGFYRVDAKFSIGTTNLTLYAEDTAGNISSKTYVVVVESNGIAEIVINIDDPIQISSCQNTRTVNVRIKVSGICESNLINGNLEFTANGTEVLVWDNHSADIYFAEFNVSLSLLDNATTWTAKYKDLNNQIIGVVSKTIQMESVAADALPIIMALDEENSIPYCEDYLNYCYSFQICGFCESIVLDDAIFDSDGAGLAITYYDLNQETNCGFFEVCGQVEPGVYTFTVEYQGQTFEPVITIEQLPNQAPEIEIPYDLNFVIQTCHSSLTTEIGVIYTDDCDIINGYDDREHAFLDEVMLTAAYISGGYFGYVITLDIEDDGRILAVEYTDEEGVTTIVYDTIHVTALPDTGSPILIYPSEDIIIDLDPCEANTTIAFFDVFAIDNCDGENLPEFNLGLFTSEGEIIEDAVFLNIGDSKMGVVLAANEEYTVAIHAEDSFGNASDGEFYIIVNQDTVADVNLICEENFMLIFSETNQALITPSMLLSGEWGCLVDDDFRVTVFNNNPENNGEYVIGCGAHDYEIYQLGSTNIEGFTAAFSPDKWQTLQDTSDNARVIFTPTSLRLEVLGSGDYGEDGFQFEEMDVMTMLAIPENGMLSFDYNFNGYDDTWAWFLINEQGNIIETYNAGIDSGFVNQVVSAGDVILFGIDDDGLAPIGPDLPSFLLIDDFSFVPAENVGETLFCSGIITTEGDVPPTLECPVDTLIFSTGPFDCSAAFVMPFPIITDSCAAYELFFDIYREVKVPTQDFGGYNLDTVSVYSGYPGEYVTDVSTKTVFIRYHAVANGDTTSIDCPIIIQDDVNPVAVCDDDVNIAIGANGTIRLYAEDVSEISHDFCSDVRIEIRREGGEWGEYIDFDCEDVQTNVIIELRVWDDANRNEIWGDWYGNDFHDADIPWDDSNDNVDICEIEVLVEDEISPTCIAPLDTSTICDNPLFPNIDWNNFDQLNEIFGEATADDNCSATSEQISVNINLNDCGWGTVVRIFSAVDDWGTESANLCNQLISIAEIHDYEIKFPKDVDIQCGEAILDTLVYNTLGCDLFTVNVNGEQYAILEPGVCVKILRTYKVINWCKWDGESNPIVISRNEDCDDDDGDEDIWVIVRTTENGGNLSYTTFLDRDNEETNFNPYIGHNRCGTGQGAALNGHWSNSNNNPELASVGFWQYTQIIKISDDEVPTLEVADYDLFCVQSGDSTASVAITFTVTENWNLDMMYLNSWIDLGADGENDGTATLIEDEAATTSTSRTFSISGAYPIGVHNFELSVTDNCHNTVNLDIPFEIMTCGPFDVNRIGGIIQTEESEGIEAVEVTLGGSGMQNDLTGNDGFYEFAETGDGLGAEYSITPYLNVQAAGSISSYDLILVTKHILGIQLLDSPYKIIAADVNNSGTVSSMDLMVLRELILGTYDEFLDNTFWRFVDANYVFPDPTNPWLEIFPEVKDITTVIYTELNHDFIGVAIGDVNNSAIPNFEATGDNRNRGDLFTLTTQNVRVKAGLNYKIDFTTTDLAKIEGYQFTLLFDKEILRFESIEYGVSSVENFGLNYISEGMITTSWDKYNGISNQENSLDEVLFSIHFYANADGSLSDMLSLSSRITKAEAYDNDGILDVAINFVSENISKTDFEVYQNIPNPFSGETRINFNLPEDANVNIMIQDMRGRLVKLIKKSGVRGFNSVMFDANTLGVAGVFYYTVSTEEYVGTKRMVIVE